MPNHFPTIDEILANALLKPFVLVFDPTFGGREVVQRFLDTRHEVKNWFSVFSDAIFIISDSSATELSRVIRAQFPTGRFFLAAVSERDGCMPKHAWDFLNNPRRSGRKPIGSADTFKS